MRGPLSTAGTTAAVLASVLFGGGAARAATVGLDILPGHTGHPGRFADADEETEARQPVSGPRFGLVVIDNSHADSWLELDRAGNSLVNSKGTAGSDHDGGGGAIDISNRDVGGSAQSQPPGGSVGHTPDGHDE
ncbi:hypothetical protein GCM10009544_19130 [Streptomyces stramineus]|uniref:Uncharacterized protein n=2 Tax=Streptomyces TaxID=1883 RepID=A0ABN0ZRV7_9ACTN